MRRRSPILDPAFQLAIYRRDGWRCIRCSSTVDIRLYRHGEPSADHPGCYGIYCAKCEARMPQL
jgi:hypothetical protein